MTADDIVHVRRVILGLEGPYADPRVATDALDNLEVWIDQLDHTQRSALADTLLTLSLDDDPCVATGAVLGLRPVAPHITATTARRAIDELGSPMLDRSPTGFLGTSAPSLRGELVLAVAPAVARHHPATARRLLDQPPTGVGRGELGMAIAPAAPDLLMEHAERWFGHDDIGVVLRLPFHFQRIAVAGALGPWPDDAHEAVDSAARWQHWADGDTAAVHRAMSGDDPFLNRPGGIEGGHGRWRIIGGTSHGWTLWLADDGVMAYETLDPGPAWTTTTRLLTADETAAVRRDGVTAVGPALSRTPDHSPATGGDPDNHP